MAEAAPPSSPPQLAERLEQCRQGLRVFLIGVTERWREGVHATHHIGFLPHTSIKNKLPYYK